MQSPYAPLPRGRSAFAAAFLSLLFPGLGHVYLGVYRRALAFAAAPVLIAALVAGVVVRLDTTELAGLVIQDWFLTGVFIANLLALGYRIVAVVDAWRLARWLAGPSPAPRTAPPGGSPVATLLALAPTVGLAAVVLVMSGLHVAVARYDLILSRTASCIFDPNGACAPDGSAAPTETAAASATEEPPAPSEAPSTVPPWDGKERLNILLLGADEQGGAHNTDTMIVVSVDPATGQAVMFQLPRDMVDVPVPAGPLRNLFGQVYSGKVNSFYAATKDRKSLPESLRGYNGLMALYSNLYGLDIRYYVEVNFDGFRKVVDALGGVTVNVQIPVTDDHFPGDTGNLIRLYIPAGVQHLNGSEALHYARARHASSDFDRAARQQRILVSLRRQVDIATILPAVDQLATAVGQSLRTNIPRDMVPQLLGLAQTVDTKTLRSVIFTPPYYGTEVSGSPRGYIIEPNVPRIRGGVQDALTLPAGFVERRAAVADEGATAWVLNGTTRTGEGARLAAYLEYLGLAATAPAQKPDLSGQSKTVVRAYNGAETKFPLSMALLEDVFGVTVTPIDDPAVRVDFVVVIGKTTPQLTPPPLP